ncbi:MAG: carboxypeptidase regulatory-like domain-containing protein, partial [Acidobacteriaceae bacterium]|nr:carboxypeptidase regulatory-like domain-containing protein [Acidobacteriaceae bacterium]
MSRWSRLLSLSLFSLSCLAQFSGNVQGVISDPSGSPIPGASIRLLNVETGVQATTTTSDSGNYRFSSLGPGHYTVTAEASGFRPAEIQVALETSQTQGINLTLQIARATQTLEVIGEAPPLDTDDSRLQETLSSQTVRDLPE